VKPYGTASRITATEPKTDAEPLTAHTNGVISSVDFSASGNGIPIINPMGASSTTEATHLTKIECCIRRLKTAGRSVM
jgi:hypothetical protein